MCTDHEEITPESLLASKKEERRNERKVFELSSQSVFYSPATAHTETKKLGKLTVRSPPKRREWALSLILKLNRVVDSGSWMNHFWQGILLSIDRRQNSRVHKRQIFVGKMGEFLRTILRIPLLEWIFMDIFWWILVDIFWWIFMDTFLVVMIRVTLFSGIKQKSNLSYPNLAKPSPD